MRRGCELREYRGYLRLGHCLYWTFRLWITGAGSKGRATQCGRRCELIGPGSHRRRWDPRVVHDATVLDRRVAHATIVDPHHPLFGCCLPVADRRSGRGPAMIVVTLPDGRQRSILRAATDLAGPSAGGPVSIPQSPISVRSLLPLANRMRIMLGCRHEDLGGVPMPVPDRRSARSAHSGPDTGGGGGAAIVAGTSCCGATATGTADGPTPSTPPGVSRPARGEA